ncbi:hypothetical protein BLX24_00310 [Arsenicibacter rosenii]|uniref:Response regulatory domain-containing protein n=2 Tax=Arsenicibacter rosenii TaxID=1750698 RepID=A0A1S2VR70_9BACT|nr:hypothetical protein BLX24_00310 [Arsenicibacter rosenii]
MVGQQATFPILLIDDDADVLEIVKRASRKTFPQAAFLGFQNPYDALAYLEKDEEDLPKLVLLDIDLGPGVMDGLSFLPQLRKHPKGSQMPTVILSSLADEERIQRAYETGATSFLEKPMNFGGWKQHMNALRQYWSEVVSLPQKPTDGSTPSPFNQLDA